jgi:hypothetical protein
MGDVGEQPFVERENDKCRRYRESVNRQQVRYATTLFLQNSGRIAILRLEILDHLALLLVDPAC